MPEGPELHLASRFVNSISKSRIFSGKILKSAVSKHVDIEWDEEKYRISATSRGKELKLTLSSVNNEGKKAPKQMDILFQFGMSGRFDFYEAKELKKHAHLNFFTDDEEGAKMVLSFVDYRRFGKWQVGVDWSPERGPCVLTEYTKFRENVLENLDNAAFNKPICETLLNQKFFNGIGNYLRAEILYRLKIPPFTCARSVLEQLADVEDSKVSIKQEEPDILQLCNILPLEVVNLGVTGYDPEARDPDYSKFSEWLQCYYNPEMKNMADHNKRTIWFTGPPGPMAPKDVKSRRAKPILKNKKKAAKVKEDLKSESSNEESFTSEPKVKKTKARASRLTRKVLREIEAESSQAKVPKRRKTFKTELTEDCSVAKQRRPTKKSDLKTELENVSGRKIKTEKKERESNPSKHKRSKGSTKKFDVELKLENGSVQETNMEISLETGHAARLKRPTKSGDKLLLKAKLKKVSMSKHTTDNINNTSKKSNTRRSSRLQNKV